MSGRSPDEIRASIEANRTALALSIGVLPGAQLGARLSRRFTGPTIRKFLGVALLGLAVRLLISAIA